MALTPSTTPPHHHHPPSPIHPTNSPSHPFYLPQRRRHNKAPSPLPRHSGQIGRLFSCRNCSRAYYGPSTAITFPIITDHCRPSPTRHSSYGEAPRPTSAEVGSLRYRGRLESDRRYTQTHTHTHTLSLSLSNSRSRSREIYGVVWAARLPQLGPITAIRALFRLTLVIITL